MLKKISIVLVAALISAAVSAEDVQLAPNHPDQYTVRKGDTLWDIAGKFLARPWQWPDIWHANPQIKNPDLIYPGDELVLVYKDGMPSLELKGGERHLGGRTYKLEPTIREYPNEEAIKAIPLDSIRPFLDRPLVVDEGVLEDAPYVVSSADQHLITGAGNRIYVRGITDESVTRYTIFRKGDAYRDPGDAISGVPGTATGKILGYEALDVGDAVIQKFGDPATAYLVRTNREVLNGDRLLPEKEESLPEFVPHAPKQEVHGNIVSVIDGVAEIGRNQIVVLNVGKDNGIAPGDVLAIYQSSLTVTDNIKTALKQREQDKKRLKFQYSATSPVDSLLEHVANDLRNTKRALDRNLGFTFSNKPEEVRLPEERAGEVMVFRAFDKVSYALVMQTTTTVHIYDSVRNP